MERSSLSRAQGGRSRRDQHVAILCLLLVVSTGKMPSPTQYIKPIHSVIDSHPFQLDPLSQVFHQHHSCLECQAPPGEIQTWNGQCIAANFVNVIP